MVDRGKPAVRHIPTYERSLGAEAGTVLDELGVTRMPWHDLVLRHAMAVKPDERWMCEDVALVMPWRDDRQTDQNIAFQRAIVGAVLLTERVLYVSESSGAKHVMFDAFTALVESAPVLSNMVTGIRRANGHEGVTFQGGGTVKFRAPARGGLRGESADLLIADNARHLPDDFEGQVGPMVATAPNLQTWWIDTTPDGWRHTTLHNRAAVAVEQPVLYLEWAGTPC
jgi:hypothetical protein